MGVQPYHIASLHRVTTPHTLTCLQTAADTSLPCNPSKHTASQIPPSSNLPTKFLKFLPASDPLSAEAKTSTVGPIDVAAFRAVRGDGGCDGVSAAEEVWSAKLSAGGVWFVDRE